MGLSNIIEVYEMPKEDTERGVWSIQYNGGKVRYSTDRTDEFLAKLSPDFLPQLLNLVGRPDSPELRALVEREWPRDDVPF